MIDVLFHSEIGLYSLVALIFTIGVGFVVSYYAKRILRDNG